METQHYHPDDGGFYPECARCKMNFAAPDLLKALQDCQEIMDACADQFCTGEYIDPAEVQATCNQLAEHAMKARAAIAKATGQKGN